MKYPFIKYVETLVMRKLPPEDVKAGLDIYNLEMPLSDIMVIREGLEKAFPEYFKSPEIVPPSEVLEQINIETMFAYLYKVYTPKSVKGVKGSFEVVNDMLMYRLITSLALAKITEEDIELIVNGKFNIDYEHEDIESFLHYFFDVQG